jgi:hypothetical protein
MRSKLATPLGARHSPLVGSDGDIRAIEIGEYRNEARRQRSETASKTFSNLINSFIQRAESGVKASVVKAEQIGKY